MTGTNHASQTDRRIATPAQMQRNARVLNGHLRAEMHREVSSRSAAQSQKPQDDWMSSVRDMVRQATRVIRKDPLGSLFGR
ncbi:hypothetical protein [Rothia halotolerans]|uniref:hypothetical protein n=1 Tax=Rothia halotolerans TaxID=405770 RepID=UPI00101E1EDB|nr:hypothetical protein [Rothia halotolerans]